MRIKERSLLLLLLLWAVWHHVTTQVEHDIDIPYCSVFKAYVQIVKVFL